MKVVVTANGLAVDGEVVDVSLSGLGVYVPANSLVRGAAIQVDLPLPEGHVTLPGRITSVTPSGQQQRLSITFTRNAQEVAIIMRYVKDRRIEILDEVGQLYDAQFRAQG